MASLNSAFLHALFLLFLIVMLPSLATAGNRSWWLSGRSGGAHLEEDESEGNGTLWAVLVAGSNYYIDYGHQADVCHAYQLLKKRGVKDENVIVFMYDNIANHPENPRPGIIINNPTGEDVYSGVPKDYTGENATAENLFAVLLGNRARLQGGSGKILDSKPDDRIFIFYSGWADPGSLEMPDYSRIFADDFITVLTEMHAAGTYKEMVIYVNGPGSGTIFDGLLPKDLNIYVTTSSSSSENIALMMYCPKNYTYPPAPPEYDVCIASLYSVSWMEDSEMQNRKDETLGEQYEIVKNKTYYNDNRGERGTHVTEYGTIALRSKKIYLFQGSSDANSSEDLSNLNNPVLTGVDQRDADLIFLQRKYNKLADGSEEKSQILSQIKDLTNHRAHLARSIDKIGFLLFGNSVKRYSVLGARRDEGLPFVDDWGCLKSMVRAFEIYCGSMTRHGLKHMQAFANMCNNGVTPSAMEEASKEVCLVEDNLGPRNAAI